MRLLFNAIDAAAKTKKFNLGMFINCQPQQEEQNFDKYERHPDLRH